MNNFSYSFRLINIYLLILFIKLTFLTFRFKWVNVAVLSSDDVCCFGKPDPKWVEVAKNSMSKIAKAYPGK